MVSILHSCSLYVHSLDPMLHALAQLVERASSRQQVMGLIPALGDHSLLVGLVSVKCDWLRQKLFSLHSVFCVTGF